MQPHFKQLQYHQLVMASEQVRIIAFTKRSQAAKKMYSKSMCELKSINAAVHQAREEHARSLTAMLIFGEEEFVPNIKIGFFDETEVPILKPSEETPEITPE